MTSLPQIPPELCALMAEIGPRWSEDVSGHVKLMVERFTQLHAGTAKTGIAVRRDIAYGTHPRQSLDVFMPATSATARAALLFVHGGAFVEGHRNRTGEIYANVLYYFARHDIVGVNIGYRLAPEAQYQEATRNVAAAVQWVRQHAGERGVDPSRLFLAGHSAGGAHTASYAYDRRLHPADGPGIAGLFVISGRVRADNLVENPNARKVEAYYGADAARLADCSPVAHVDAASVPTVIAMGEYENPLIGVYCLELAYRLAQVKRRAPPVLWLKGYNHTSMIAHLNTAEEALGRAMLDFIHEPT